MNAQRLKETIELYPSKLTRQQATPVWMKHMTQLMRKGGNKYINSKTRYVRRYRRKHK